MRKKILSGSFVSLTRRSSTKNLKFSTRLCGLLFLFWRFSASKVIDSIYARGRRQAKKLRAAVNERVPRLRALLCYDVSPDVCLFFSISRRATCNTVGLHRGSRNILESFVRISATSVKWPDGTSSWLITVESCVYVYTSVRSIYTYVYFTEGGRTRRKRQRFAKLKEEVEGKTRRRGVARRGAAWRGLAGKRE